MRTEHLKTQHLALMGLAILSVASCAMTVPAGADPRSADTLVEEVRRATNAFHDVSAARAAGYAPFLGSVTGPQEGAMGIHFVNSNLVGDGLLDPRRPEALMYEPKDGQLRLVGVEYLVLADAWNSHNAEPPTLGGSRSITPAARTATASPPSTPFTSGRGSRIRTARSWTGTPQCCASSTRTLWPPPGARR
jgi:hypothetical protein